MREAIKETKEEERGNRRKTDQLHLENRSLLEQASEEYGDVQLLVRKPRVSVSSGERKVAELALKGLGSRQKAEEDIIARQRCFPLLVPTSVRYAKQSLRPSRSL